MKKITAILSLIMISALISACNGGGGSRTSIVVAGSTSVQPYAEFLAEEYEKLYPGQHAEISGGGSSVGINAVESGVADIGMSSRSLKDYELDFWSTVIAKDGLAIIINPGNPITNLTREQICAIYSAEITNWSELGGEDRKIHVMAREEGSGTRSQFAELVMGNIRITPKAIVQNSNGAIKQLVASDLSSIGFISLGVVDETVKAIEIDGVPASIANVRNGTYALYRSFLFITKEKPEGMTKDFIDFVLSDAGKELLINEGLIP
ncbi:MAG: phosphate ABC transporter substrate-binding protein [Lachnospiraceae bacterium]|nr:phosphate ABC transporter substrate-binding protein [Lachnospiraceae bacterium]